VDFEAGKIDTRKEFPIRGARALARELSGIRVALVLGAGGARGWAHLGVIKVLEEANIHIDMIVGSSIGSMVGCLYAYSACIDETIELVRSTLPTKFQAKRKLFDYTIPINGIIRGSKIGRMVRDAVDKADFLDLKIPACCMAVDYHTGESVIIDKGDVAQAVRASISLPGIMNPVLHKGRWLIDGGLLAPVPVDVAIQRGAGIVIASCVERGKNELTGNKSRPPGIMSVLSRTMNIVHAHVTRDYAQKADVVLYPDVEGFAWDAFHRVSDLIDAGENACREKIEEIKQLISFRQRSKPRNGVSP
jgi:NTE family protein